MGAFKQFTTQDIIVTPFNVKKGFRIYSCAFTSSNIGIDRFIGLNISSSTLFSSSSFEPTTGFITTQFQRLVYNSIKQLYYTNYIPDPIPTSSYFIGTTDVHSRFDNYLQSPNLDSRSFDTSSNAQIGVISIPSGLYGNRIHPGTFKYEINYLPTSSFFNAVASSSISQFVTEKTIQSYSASLDLHSGLIDLYHVNATASNAAYKFNTVFPSSVSLTGSVVTHFTGSGADEVFFYINKGINNDIGTYIFSQSLSSSVVGITSMSFLIQEEITPSLNDNFSMLISNGYHSNITASFIFNYNTPSPNLSSMSIYDDGEGNIYNSLNNAICGNIIYPHGLIIITSSSFSNDFINFITGSSSTCSFSSSMTIYESQYKCTIRENEFNFSLNPSLISGSDGQVYDFVTGSVFTPYVTTVGLYNNKQELLAVAKLAKPLNLSDTTDSSIILRIDR